MVTASPDSASARRAGLQRIAELTSATSMQMAVLDMVSAEALPASVMMVSAATTVPALRTTAPITARAMDLVLMVSALATKDTRVLIAVLSIAPSLVLTTAQATDSVTSLPQPQLVIVCLHTGPVRLVMSRYLAALPT